MIIITIVVTTIRIVATILILILSIAKTFSFWARSGTPSEEIIVVNSTLVLAGAGLRAWGLVAGFLGVQGVGRAPADVASPSDFARRGCLRVAGTVVLEMNEEGLFSMSC